ncbi:SDR family NAD(P)-dependent oxidoreductase [Lentzea flaviverrucosa]|uniref:NAD(P)-dependent dehydrogenase, short-chain alcohol dehydrogenase family n=1 Tax=Lentzea flaviverrucosa TaxID=200379 RepID=A0A1H9AM76_9PSEU|nr:SDR family NAD(P)-dependent oxidoreductase [Lentzea flaviverrucosa]RDI32023.1 NAD(P)-dependent dehydrogenase (short-subunit alcohol dehydrogenase family) [Lentzea flaviverrucosa]SEP77846.1 NAD(P)-dependent dehydrogenase, short-chain alcohol dehydrogenase family [Lentzea flaviverrucosa]
MAPRAVVTAGTGGIGLETALGLAAAGYAVTVVGRNPERGARAVERINAGAGEPARYLQADLASLDEVRALAPRIAAEGELAVLVNNVGAMFPDHTRINGVEATFVVNHLSPYLLTESLLPVLTGRVVNVTSGSITTARKNFDDVEPPGGYYGFHWYGRAKLANLAYTLDLAHKQTNVSVLAADPGGAATDMTDGTLRTPKIVSPGLRLLWPLVRRTFERATSGPASAAARPSILAATDHTLASGTVIGRHVTPVRPNRTAADPRVQQAVRRLSERHAPLVRVPDGVSN